MYKYGISINKRSFKSSIKSTLKSGFKNIIIPVLAISFVATPLVSNAKGQSPSTSSSNTSQATYSVNIKDVSVTDNTTLIGGSASVSNFTGREDEQYLKIVWGDDTSSTEKLMNLTGYLKSSKNISVNDLALTHTYPSINSWQISIKVYRGNSSGNELSSSPSGQVSFSTENTFGACSDGTDNDKDTAKDLFDNDCAKFRSTENTVILCNDGIDNDINGQFDLQDVNCAEFIPKEDTDVTCNDGIDNDLDGRTDLLDTGCVLFIPKEDTQATCTDGIDNDIDGQIDTLDSGCAAFIPTPTVVQTTPENTASVCLDGIDNDLDGLFDWEDSDCAPFAQPANCPLGYIAAFIPGYGYICGASAGY